MNPQGYCSTYINDFTHVDALTTIEDHLLYFFIGNQYACYDLNKGLGVDGYPKTLQAGFAGLSFKTVDAVFNSGFGKLYFFSGRQFSRYDLRDKKVDSGYPKSIKHYWPRLRLSSVDAVLNRGDGKVYFVSGSVVMRYDIHKERVDRGYPKRIKRVWPKLGFDYLDGACVDAKGYGYFFCGDQYIRYDLNKQQVLGNYPKPMNAKSWPGVNFTANNSQRQKAHVEANPQVYRDVDDSVSWIDGAFEHQGKVYFFYGSQFLRYDDSTDNGRVAAGFPQKISHKFVGLSLNGAAGHIKGCIATGNSKVQLFHGDSCSRFDLTLNRMDEGYPKPISQLWSNLSFERIDSVFNLGRYKVYFSSGNRVSRGDLRTGKIDSGYPKFIARQWPGLGLSRISAAFANGRGQYYFFAGDRYTRWDSQHHQPDSGYPRLVDGHNWPGMDFKPKPSKLNNINGICQSNQLSLMPAKERIKEKIKEKIKTRLESKQDASLKVELTGVKQRIDFVQRNSQPCYQLLISLPVGVESVWLQSAGAMVHCDIDGKLVEIGSRALSVLVGSNQKIAISVLADGMNIPGIWVSRHQTLPNYLHQDFRFVIRLDKPALTQTANIPVDFLIQHRQQLQVPVALSADYLRALVQSIIQMAKAVQYTLNDIAGQAGCYHDAHICGENMCSAYWQMDFTTGQFTALSAKEFTALASNKSAKSRLHASKHFACRPQWLKQCLSKAPVIERLMISCVDDSGRTVGDGCSVSEQHQNEMARLQSDGDKLVRGEISGSSAGILTASPIGVANRLTGGESLAYAHHKRDSIGSAQHNRYTVKNEKVHMAVTIVAQNESWQYVLRDTTQLGELIALTLAQVDISVGDYLALLAKPFDWEKTIGLSQLLNNMLSDGIGKIPDIVQHLQQETHEALEVARANIGQSVDASVIEHIPFNPNRLAQMPLSHDVSWFLSCFARGNYTADYTADSGEDTISKDSISNTLQAAEREKLEQGFHYLIIELEQLKDKLPYSVDANLHQSLIKTFHDMLNAPSLQRMALLMRQIIEDLTPVYAADASVIFKRFSLLVFAQLPQLVNQILCVARWHYHIPYYSDVYQFITGAPMDLLSALSFSRAVPSCFWLEAFDCDLRNLQASKAPDKTQEQAQNENDQNRQAQTLQLVCRVLHSAGPSIASPLMADSYSDLFSQNMANDESLSQGASDNRRATEFKVVSQFIDCAMMQITGAFGGDLLQGDNPNELGRNIWGYQWTQGLIEAYIGLQGAKVMQDKQALMQSIELSRCLHQLLSAGLLPIGLSNFELQELGQGIQKVLPFTLARCVSLLPQLLQVCVNSEPNIGLVHDSEAIEEAYKRIEHSMRIFYLDTGIQGNNPSLIG